MSYIVRKPFVHLTKLIEDEGEHKERTYSGCLRNGCRLACKVPHSLASVTPFSAESPRLLHLGVKIAVSSLRSFSSIARRGSIKDSGRDLNAQYLRACRV